MDTPVPHPVPQAVLDLPLNPDNDSGATTVRGYLAALLIALWRKQDVFSGKKPFGRSGWDIDLLAPLVRAGYISGSFGEDGYVQDCDDKAGHALITAAIEALGNPGGGPLEMPDGEFRLVKSIAAVTPAGRVQQDAETARTLITGALLAELGRRILDYENGISWGTSCVSCARMLDSSAEERERREEAEAKLAAVREQARAWAVLAPADDWGESAGSTAVADCGRAILAVLGAADTPPLSVTALRAYLLGCGWREVSTGVSGSLWGLGDTRIGVLFDDSDPDFTSGAVARVAAAEGRTAAEVTADVLAVHGRGGGDGR